MNFIGNQKTVNILEKSIASGKISQAYLFLGPEAVGKFTLAKKIALKLINRLDLDLNLVDSEESSADLFILEPEIEEVKGVEKERDISIEKVREVQRELTLFPSHGAYRVLIVNDAHRMSLGAQNALLKTLEEPNKTSILILVTHEPNRIIDTIKSRTQKVSFRLVSESDFPEDAVSETKNISAGRPGVYYKLLNNPDYLLETKQFFEKLRQLGELNIADKFQLAEELSKNNAETIRKMELYLGWLHLGAMKDMSLLSRIEKIKIAIGRIASSNVNSKIILENLFLNY